MPDALTMSDFHAALQQRLPEAPNLQGEILQLIRDRLSEAEREAIAGTRFQFLYHPDTAGILLAKCPSYWRLMLIQQEALTSLCELVAYYTGVKQLMFVSDRQQLQVWRDRAGRWNQSQAEVM